jgi:hypothetical protein
MAKKDRFLTCIPGWKTSRQSVQNAISQLAHCKKNASLLEFSRCLSRACLGKAMAFLA